MSTLAAFRRSVAGVVGAAVGALGGQLHLLCGGAKPCCRFEPTCSRYAAQAIATRGIFRGSWLTVRRVVRCLPGGNSGIDPVPVEKELHGA